MSRTSNPNLIVDVDQTFTQEPRQATTWTRPSKTSPVRTAISPIDIPTFAGPQTNRLPATVNQNYVDDVFERYSPSPPSTPRPQQCIARPITYQRAKRSDPVQPHSTFFASAITRGHYPPKTFHLPPLKAPSPRKYQQYFPTANFRPWR